MTLYKVNVLEKWYRTGHVHADCPEQAAAIAGGKDPEGTVMWEEAEYLTDIPDTVEVSNPETKEILYRGEGA